jgi:hypothetical protein
MGMIKTERLVSYLEATIAEVFNQSSYKLLYHEDPVPSLDLAG